MRLWPCAESRAVNAAEHHESFRKHTSPARCLRRSMSKENVAKSLPKGFKLEGHRCILPAMTDMRDSYSDAAIPDWKKNRSFVKIWHISIRYRRYMSPVTDHNSLCSSSKLLSTPRKLEMTSIPDMALPHLWTSLHHQCRRSVDLRYNDLTFKGTGCSPVPTMKSSVWPLFSHLIPNVLWALGLRRSCWRPGRCLAPWVSAPMPFLKREDVQTCIFELSLSSASLASPLHSKTPRKYHAEALTRMVDCTTLTACWASRSHQPGAWTSNTISLQEDSLGKKTDLKWYGLATLSFYICWWEGVSLVKAPRTQSTDSLFLCVLSSTQPQIPCSSLSSYRRQCLFCSAHVMLRSNYLFCQHTPWITATQSFRLAKSVAGLKQAEWCFSTPSNHNRSPYSLSSQAPTIIYHALVLCHLCSSWLSRSTT